MKTNIFSSIFVLGLGVLVLSIPADAFAQGNNMNIYNKILQQYNHPSQKNWQRQQAEAPMLDVDQIVRQENEARRRQQQSVRPPAPVRQGCTPSATGCGPMGLQVCTCVNGKPTWVPHGHVQYR